MLRLLPLLLLSLGCFSQLHVHEVYGPDGHLTQRTRTSQRVLGTADVSVATSRGDMVGEGKDGGISDNFTRVVPCVAAMGAGAAAGGLGTLGAARACQPVPMEPAE